MNELKPARKPSDSGGGCGCLIMIAAALVALAFFAGYLVKIFHWAAH